MNKLFNVKTFLLVGFCFVTNLFISCNDNETDVGIHLQPEDSEYSVYHVTDSVIDAFTYQQSDSIWINPPVGFLGLLNDDRFGKYTYGFMSELNLELQDEGYISTGSVFDSLLLNLEVIDFYGSADEEHTVNMYYLKRNTYLTGIDATPNDPDNISAIVDEYAEMDQPICSFSYNPKTDNTLNIELDADIILQDLSAGRQFIDSGGVMFREQVIRGFYFEVQDYSGKGGVNLIDLSTSYLEAHFHNSTDTTSYKFLFSSALVTETDSTDTEIVIDAESVTNVNIYGRSYTNEISQVLQFYENPTPDYTVSQEYIYVKDNNALEARIAFTNLGKWKDSGQVFINAANLELQVDYQDYLDSTYFTKNYLYVYVDTAKTGEEINYFDEATKLSYNKESQSYTLSLTEVYNDFVNLGLDQFNITLTTRNYGADRVVIFGPDHETNPMKLDIIYTKLN